MGEMLCASARFILAGAIFIGITSPLQATSPSSLGAEKNLHGKEVFGKLPSAFEENRGQMDPAVKFLFRTNNYQLFLTNHDAVMVLQGHGNKNRQNESLAAKETREEVVVRMRLDGSNETPAVTGIDPSASKQITLSVLTTKSTLPIFRITHGCDIAPFIPALICSFMKTSSGLNMISWSSLMPIQKI